MAKLPGLFPRGGVYYLRVMIPLHLRPAYAGRTKLVESLSTGDSRLARFLGAQVRAARLAEFEKHRAVCFAQSTTPQAVPVVSDWLAWHALQAPDSPPPGAPRPLRAPPPPQAPPALPSTSKHILRQVYDKWAPASDGGIDAKRACLRAVVLFEEWAGQSAPQVESLSRAQGHEFKAWLLAKAKAGQYSSKTVHGYLVSVCGLLRFAHEELEWASRHPWRGISIDYETESPRARWSAKDFETMAALPLFSQMELPKGWKPGAEAAYWLPLLGLYTGATVSELAQLTVEDVKDEGPDGLWLRFTDTGDGQKLKTEMRRRTVPVHSELLRLGFQDHVEAVKAEGAKTLWPRLRLHPTKPGTYFSGWWGEFRRAPDGTETLPDFHSMRHTARSTMADGGFDSSGLDVITGHGKKGSEGVRTYTKFSRAFLRSAIESIRYPALRGLPRRMPAQDC